MIATGQRSRSQDASAAESNENLELLQWDSAVGEQLAGLELPALAARAQIEHQAVVLHAQSTILHAIRAGNLLDAIKLRLKHGDFLLWVEEHCGVSARQAQRYMKVALRVRTAPDTTRASFFEKSIRLLTEPLPESVGTAATKGPSHGGPGGFSIERRVVGNPINRARVLRQMVDGSLADLIQELKGVYPKGKKKATDTAVEELRLLSRDIDHAIAELTEKGST